MKKLLCVLLAICLLPWGMAFAAETTATVTFAENDAYYKNPGETPWAFEWTPVGKDEYQPLEFINTGWYHETFQNWSYGTVQEPGKMHTGRMGDPVVSFTAPVDGKIAIAKTTATKGENNASDGVQIKILKNDAQIFPETDWAVLLPGGKVEIPELVLEVKKGDIIHFRANCIENQNADSLSWKKTITYLRMDGTIVSDGGTNTPKEETVKPAAPQYSAVLGIETMIPEDYSASVTYTEKDGYYKQPGETPWSFEWTPVGKDEYQPLEFIDSGWFHETFQNWSYGAVQFPGSMHAGTIGDPVVAFTAPSDGKIVIAKANASKAATTLSDGVQIKILKNDEQIFP